MACGLFPVQCLCQSHSCEISCMPSGPPSYFVNTIIWFQLWTLKQRLLVATGVHAAGVAWHPIHRQRSQQRSLWEWLAHAVLV